MTALRQAVYSPAIFNVADIAHAKSVILTPEDHATDVRWEKETPYLLSLIEQSIPLTDESVVLDYGCGIGRMSKALIERFGCSVVGVDISKSMRELARDYVASDRFTVCAPDELVMPYGGFDAAIAIWVLQHCFDPVAAIDMIAASLKSRGHLFVVNDHHRIVPCREGWISDGKDVLALIKQKFTGDRQDLDASIVGKRIADCSYWAAFQKAA